MTSSSCKNKCNSYHIGGFNYTQSGRGAPRYPKGYKYCSICKFYIQIEELCCFCCGIRYRTNRRSHKKLMTSPETRIA